MELLDCSADPDPNTAGLPFKERIRPGMVVAWDASAGEYARFAVGGKSYAVVMCPVGGVGGWVRDVRGEVVNPSREGGENGEGKGQAYLCAMVMPAMLPGSYGVSLWRQVVVGVEEMEGEVLMEWDEATRYYYLTV
jgi:kinesin family protein 2/24